MTPTILRRCALALYLAGSAVHAADTAAPAAAETPPPNFEGAIGAVVSYRNEYLGGRAHAADVGPAFYLRYKRVSISHASGFVTRRREELPLGLGLELVRRSEVRLNLGLRIDRGRESSASGALAGVEDVRGTLRARTGLVWQAGERWRLNAGWAVDLLGRGGGHTLDAGVAWEQPVGHRSTWAIGTTLTWADGRYMRSYHGITPAASAINGLPVYQPGGGLRDVALSTTLRTEFGSMWSAYVGGGIGRVLGPAADSPLTHDVRPWWVGTGLARRF